MMRDLSMHIMDIVQNSVAAGAANINIEINEDKNKNLFSFSVADDGRGMTQEFADSLRDPFVTSRETRRVGLGVPLLAQTCAQCGGRLSIESSVGMGTALKAEMELNNIDLPPLGDVGECFFLLAVMNPGITFVFIYNHNGKTLRIDMAEIAGILDGVPLDSPDVSAWLKEYIGEHIAEVARDE